MQVAPGARDGAAGAGAGDEVGDPAVGVAPDLGAGRLVVRQRAVGVGVLVGLPGARGLAHQPVGRRVVGVGVVRRHGGRADDDLGAVGLEHVALVLGDLVGADEDARVAATLGDQGQPDAGVARGRLDDDAARLQLAGGLGRLDHLQRDAVLHRPARVEVLDLGQHRGRDALGHRAQLDEGGVSDEVDDVLRVLHPVILSWPGCRPAPSVTGRRGPRPTPQNAEARPGHDGRPWPAWTTTSR